MTFEKSIIQCVEKEYKEKGLIYSKVSNEIKAVLASHLKLNNIKEINYDSLLYELANDKIKRTITLSEQELYNRKTISNIGFDCDIDSKNYKNKFIEIYNDFTTKSKSDGNMDWEYLIKQLDIALEPSDFKNEFYRELAMWLLYENMKKNRGVLQLLK